MPWGNKEPISTHISIHHSAGRGREGRMPLPCRISCVACSPYTSLREMQMNRERAVNEEEDGTQWWQSTLSGGRGAGLLYIIMHGVACFKAAGGGGGGDVSGPVRLTHLPTSQVCAPCRPPADTAPARHWRHNCRWLKHRTHSLIKTVETNRKTDSHFFVFWKERSWSQVISAQLRLRCSEQRRMISCSTALIR